MLSAEEKQQKLAQWRKLRCCTICFLVTGLVLVILCAFTPKAMDAVLVSQAKKTAQLTPANEQYWRGIPGKYDLGIYWNQYFYNCTNAMDVTYKNAKPEFQEFGPYVYREYDEYNNLNYTSLDNVIGQEQLPVVKNNFNQSTVFDSDGDGFIDTPMFLTNQALFGVWYQQNSMQAEENQWRVYLTLLYSAVQDGLGRQVVQNGVWQQMQSSDFST